ncbi:MAG TPA: 2-oxoacid:acceptor oxidoreductase family protein [Acidimicrobiales bacterium]|nr:2-oxoacid:acceptor oxidoreductase family protein [Acidimicrobiales bacterium]
MERELVLTGIGGQGIQLAAQVIARAALAEGRAVQIFGSYGGMMRGGNTEATVVFADDVIESPPTVGHAWSAILMHHDYSAPTLALLRPESVAFVNTSVFEGDASTTGATVVGVEATELATSVGNPLAAAMVMAGAYTAATGLVALESLVDAVGASLPPYRQQHVEVNVAALRAGFDAAPRDIASAWELSAC